MTKEFATMTPATLFARATRSKAAELMSREINTLKETLQRFQDEGRRPEYIQQSRFEGIEAIQADIRQANAARVEELNGELGKVAERWKSDYRRNLGERQFELDALKTRYAGHLPDELIGEAQKYLQNDRDARDPHAVDILASALKSAGLAIEHEAVRKAAVSRRYTEPWAIDGVGRDIADGIQAHANAGGDAPTWVDGKLAVFSVTDVLDD